jgi:hypothetical protein
MQRLPQQISLFAVSLITISVIAAAPVFAERGSGRDGTATVTPKVEDSATHRSGDNGTSTTSTTKVEKTEHSTELESDTEHPNGDDSVTTRKSELRSRAEKLLAAERQDKKVKSLEDRRKSCEARRAGLTTRSANYSRNAKKHLDTFNTVYDKVLAFQAEKQLTAGDFATLKATADAKKAAAISAVAALEDPSVTIDCTASDPAVGVATLKTSVGNARKSLQEYRTAIKNLVAALQSAKDEDNSSANNSTEAN